MAKTSIRRHHGKRLLKKWDQLTKKLCIDVPTNFGKIYKQDPIDCGNPSCGICSRHKVYDTRRSLLRQEERNSYLDLM